MNEQTGSKASLERIKPAVIDDLAYHETREITVQMPFGTHHKIQSPWFRRTGISGRRRKGPKVKSSGRKGCHVFLDLFGFSGSTSQTLLSKALKMSILCPSAAIASEIMKDDGITFSQNKLRSCIGDFGHLSDEQRALLSRMEGESLKGKRVLLCIDGGRIRSRKTKKGRIPEGQKRHGFSTDWKEPKMFTIYTLTKEGEIDKSYPAHVDAAIGNEQRFCSLLESYLRALSISECESITLVGDGAKWQWSKVPALLRKLKVKKSQMTQIIDHMHARQNLCAILENCSKGILNALHDDLKEQAFELLYSGNTEQLWELIEEHSNKGHKRKNRKKFNSYFWNNRNRMQYEKFRQKKLPIGSGAVESAIRRVINLRIKSPGIFWKTENAEAMIFIRSKLLYGRWETLMKNHKKARQKSLVKSELQDIL